MAGENRNKPHILVIGCGGAGLAAAIAARMSNADVTVVSKTAPGTATCTLYSGGIFSVAWGAQTPDKTSAETFASGRGVNDKKLVAVLAREGGKSLETLAEWGVRIRFRDGKGSVRATRPNSILGGGGMVHDLLEIAKALGVRFLEEHVATELLEKNGRVCGAALVDWRTGKKYRARADAVILAAGGAGHVFSRTDNPARMTGDAYALALEAGLALRDMEFVQFYPTGWAEEGLPVWMIGLEVADYIRITDANGAEFIKNALPGWGCATAADANLYARDRSAFLIAQKAASGGVFLHLEDATEAVWNDRRFVGSLTLNDAFFRHLSRAVKIAPVQHYCCGGVVIDEWTRTGLEGLYACGESTGGVDGANRIGGNALTNVMTFGLRAGRTAVAECAGGAPFALEPDGTWTPAAASGRVARDVRETRRKIQEIAWEKLGCLRDARGIEEARQALLAIQEDYERGPLAVDSPYERLLALELKGQLETALAVASAAALRAESRGNHFRTDAPREDPACERPILVSRTAEKFQAAWSSQ